MLAGWQHNIVPDTILDHVRLWDFPAENGYRQLDDLFRNEKGFLKKL